MTDKPEAAMNEQPIAPVIIALVALFIGIGLGSLWMRSYDAQFVAETVRYSDHDFKLDVRQCVAALDATKCIINGSVVDPMVFVECAPRANVKDHIWP